MTGYGCLLLDDVQLEKLLSQVFFNLSTKRLESAIIWVGNVQLFSFLSLAALELPYANEICRATSGEISDGANGIRRAWQTLCVGYALFALQVAYLAGAKMSFRLYVADSRRGYTL